MLGFDVLLMVRAQFNDYKKIFVDFLKEYSMIKEELSHDHAHG